MTAQWARVKELLDQLLDRDPADRALAIEEIEDPGLRREVESLLAYAGNTGRLDECLYKAVLSVSDSDAMPATAGPYRIERPLGSGGMGTVYLGVRDDDQLPSKVAIKVIQSGGGRYLWERFRRERRILAGLIHPYIARLLDAGMLEDRRPYFVMEYVEGQPVQEYVARNSLHVAEILRLFLKICSAVQFAHQNLVIHRDLKPGNILITDAGEPRLLDFGIAKLLAEETSENEQTRPEDRVLTPAAASPEQTTGGPVTMASDVYSLGVLLYRLLTGVSPYAQAKNFEHDAARVIREFAPPPPSAVPSLPARTRRELRRDLDNIIRKAIEKDPNRRYSTVHELAADVERRLKGLPVQARPASLPYRVGKFVRRHRMGVTAAALVVIAIGGGMAGSLYYAHRAHRAEIRALERFESLRKITHSLLFEIHGAIQNLPGATAARGLLLHRVVEYLGQLSGESIQDPVVLNDLAEAYILVASIENGTRGARLGGSPRDSLAMQQKALEIRTRLAAEFPGDRKYRADLESAMWEVAATYSYLGDIQKSLENQARLLAMREQDAARDNTPENRYSMTTPLIAIGDLRRILGDLDASLDCHRRSLKIREALVDSDPTNARYRRGLGIAHEFAGYTYTARREYANAAREQGAAATLFESVLKNDPNNTDLQRMALVSEENLCESLAYNGRGSEAEGHCKTALEVAREMYNNDKKDIQALEDLASVTSSMSLAVDRAGNPAEALVWQQHARKLFDAAVESDPNDLDLNQDNGESLIELAAIQSELHRFAEARSAADSAVSLLQALSTRMPQNHVILDLLHRAQEIRNSIQR